MTTQSIIRRGNIVPKEGNPEQASQDEGQGSEYPNDKREQHAGKDDGLLVVLLGEGSDLLEELAKHGSHVATFCWNQLQLDHGVEGNSIDHLSGTLADNDANPGWEG